MGFVSHPQYDEDGKPLKISKCDSPEKIMEISRGMDGHEYFLWLE